MRRSKVLLVLAIVFVLMFTVACGKKEAGGEKLRIGMVTDVGGVNDQSFNQSAWEGLQEARDDLDVEVGYIESKQDADYPQNMETMLDSDNDLIWGIGFKMGDIIKEVADANPEQKYAIIDYSYGPQTPDNVIGVVFRIYEATFLVGYIAGRMTRTETVGFVGGIKIPLIEEFEFGYIAGVKYANKNIKVLSQYAASFSDAAKGKAIANQMFSQSADIIFHAAGGVGDGVIEAAKEQGKYAIGVDRDQNYLAPNNVITSAMKLVGRAIYNVVEDLQDGKYEGGSTVAYGLEEGGVGIAPTSGKLVPQDILDDTKKLEKRVVKGEIDVPSTAPALKDFLSGL